MVVVASGGVGDVDVALRIVVDDATASYGVVDTDREYKCMFLFETMLVVSYPKRVFLKASPESLFQNSYCYYCLLQGIWLSINSPSGVYIS